MISATQPWAPLDALLHDQVTKPLATVVIEWSERWFSDRRLSAGGFSTVREAPSGEGVWTRFGGELSLRCGRRAADRVVGWALGVDLLLETPNDDDRLLLAAFEQRMWRNLAESLVANIGGAPPNDAAPHVIANPIGRDGGLVFRIQDERSGELACVAIPAAILWPLRRGNAGQPRRGALPTPVRAALSDTTVRLEAILGHSKITLSDLRNLAPDDVLMLDRPIESGACLRLAGTSTTIAAARVTSQDGHLALSLIANS